jgi:DNA-binding CsgD family transcriptional regulator
MEELKHHSHRFSADTGERDHLRKVVQNALQQTERVCALVKEIAGNNPGVAAVLAAKGGWRERTERAPENGRAAGAVLLSDSGQKPLTRREREVLNLISEGYSNKQGALRMQISPRTFESHRAEAMRKLGARNTADLVRAVLLHPVD